MTVHGYNELLKQHQKRINEMHARANRFTNTVLQMQERLIRAAHPLFQKKNSDKLAAQRAWMIPLTVAIAAVVFSMIVWKVFYAAGSAAAFS